MPFITLRDGAQLFYKDWGSGQPIVFSHGWPLTAEEWDVQMMFFADRGYRVVAHDRRGHGRSTQTWDRNDMDNYADDLRELVEALDLQGAIHVGHSTGGGEVIRYLARHGTDRAAGAAILAAIPPVMLKSATNPEGTPIEAFDGIRDGTLNNRSQFYRDLASGPFYGFNRPGVETNQGLVDKWWLQGMMGGVKGHYDCIKQFSETDFTEDLQRIDVPVMVMHGDDDQIVPIAASAPLAAALLPRGVLKVYPGFPHGMPSTHHAVINPDLLAFFREQAAARTPSERAA